MRDDSVDNKLDETIKNTLRNYEVKFDADDWSAMEKMLGVSPKSSSVSWRYLLVVVIGIIILGGGYLIIKKVNSPQPSTEGSLQIPSPKKIILSPQKTTPIRPNATMVSPTTDTTRQATSADTTNHTAPVFIKTTTATSKVKKSPTEKSKKDKTAIVKSESSQKQPAAVGENKSTVDNRSDSSKSIVPEPKETEITKKAEKSPTHKISRWNFLRPTKDSLKRKKDKTPKDTLGKN